MILWALPQLSSTPNPPAAYITSLERARAEYWSGHFVESEHSFIAALQALPQSEQFLRARTLSDLGDVYVNEDELPQAEQAYQKSLAIYEKIGDKQNAAGVLRNLGAVYSLQRRDDQSLRACNKALKLAKSVPQPDPDLLKQVYNSLGVSYFRQGKLDKAEEYFFKALALLPAATKPFNRADLLNNLGTIYRSKREFERAEQYIKQSLALTESEVGTTHPDVTFSLSALALLYADMRRYADAEAQYRRALAILNPNSPVFETRIARLLHGLSGTLAAAGRESESESTLAQAAAVARRSIAGHPDMALILDDYAARLRRDGKQQKAAEVQLEAKRARVAAALVVKADRPFPY